MSAPAQAPPDLYRRVSGVLFLSGLSGTVANVSVAVVATGIARDFGLGLSAAAVIVIALNLTMALFMPLAGWVSGRVGTRRVLAGSAVILAVSSVAMAAAGGVALLVAGRLGQGIGLAGVTPTAVQAAGALLGDRDRGRALGWWSAANGAGLAVGPLLGGFLFDAVGWWAVPLPAVAIGVALAVIAAGLPGGVRGKASVGAGSALLLGGLGLSVLALSSAVSIRAWWAAAVAAADLLVVAAVAARRARAGSPLLPARWLRSAASRKPALTAGLQMFVNGMCQVAVPAWLVARAGSGQAVAGLVLVTMTGTMAVLAPSVGRRMHVTFRVWAVRGSRSMGAGLLVLSAAMSLGETGLVIVALVVVGVGSAMLLTPAFHAFGGTEAGREGVGLAVYNVMRLGAFALGGLAGVAALEAGAPEMSYLAAAALCLLPHNRE